MTDHTLPPKFWPERMTRDGCTATREQMTKAWEMWSAGNAKTHLSLIALLEEVCGHAPEKVSWPYARLADGMLQQARKAEVIFFQGSSWRLTKSVGA